MAMIAGGPHLSFTTIHELLTANTHVGLEQVKSKSEYASRGGYPIPMGRNDDRKRFSISLDA
jgi:hypothetical protein